MKKGDIGVITSDEHAGTIVTKTFWGNYQILGEDNGWGKDRELMLMVRILKPGERLVIQ